MLKRLFAPLIIITSGYLSADGLGSAFNNGKVSGELRTFYLDRDFSGEVGNSKNDRSGLATGGKLKFETEPLNGVSLGLGYYTTSRVDNSSYNFRAQSLYGEGKEGYDILGETYLQHISNSGNIIKVGRQKLDTPLAGSDDTRMLPNLFEAYLFQTNHIPDSTLILAHVSRFSAGSFSNVYSGGLIAGSSGYSIVDADSGEFTNMGSYAVGQKTDGVSTVGFINNSLRNTKFQLWNYYAHDILNALYLQIDYKYKLSSFTPFLSVQYINEQSVGNELGGEVESNYYAGEVGVTAYNFTLYGAFSQTGTSENRVGAILTPWGGMPGFTQGMVTRHMFLEDTTAVKFSGSYNLDGLNRKGSLNIYYSSFDVGENNGYVNGENWVAKESGFDLQYYPQTIENLLLRVRGNFPTDFQRGLDWSEYRFIVSYKF
jgi:hypothetical protein